MELSKKKVDMKKAVPFVLLFAVLALLLLLIRFSYTDYVRPASDEMLMEICQDTHTDHADPFTEGTTWHQTFTASRDTITGFDFYVTTFQRRNDSTFRVSMGEEGTDTPLQTWDILSTGVLDRQFLDFYLTEPVTNASGKEFYVEITSLDGTSEDAIGIFTADSNAYSDGILYENGQKTDTDLCFRVYGEPAKLVLKIFYLFCAALLITVFVLFVFLYLRPLRLECLFLVFAVFLGGIYLLLFPPLTAPDDYRHFETAYYVSSRMLGQEGTDEHGNVLVREDDYRAFYELQTANLQNLTATWDDLFSMDHSEKMVSAGHPPLEAPLYCYWLSGAGIALARLLGLGKVLMYFLGKGLIYLGYLAAGYLTIRLMPFARNLMFLIYLLPISLQQATSFSYDTTVNALAFLLTAYCLHLAFAVKKLKPGHWIVLVILAAVLAPCKVVYVLISLCCLLIPRKKASQNRQYYLGIAGTFAASLISLVLFQAGKIHSVVSDSHEVALGGTNYTLDYFLHAPAKLIGMYVRTFQEYGDFYFTSMLGGRLGRLDIDIPWMLILLFAVLLLLSVVPHTREYLFLSAWGKLWLVLICAGVISASMLGIMFDWTPESSMVIEGVQGRYFLPVLPLLLLLTRNRTLVLRKDITRGMLFTFAVLHALTALWAFGIIVAR